MNSILTNSAALSALQSLSMTQQNLATTQNQVSSGLAVQNASDNAAYWAIGQQLTSDSGIVTAANTALAQSQSVLDTATSAIASVITTIDAIQAAITEAQNPGASFNDINTTLSSLSSQLTTAMNGASFNGVNLLNGTQTSLSFVAGYEANASGGSLNTIALTATSLLGGQNAAVTGAASTATPVTDSNLITQLESATATSTTSNGVTSATAVAGGVVTVTTTDAFGDTNVATYTGYTTGSGATGTAATTNTPYSSTNTGGASNWTVSTQTTTVAGSPAGALIQYGATTSASQYNLTQLGSANTAYTQVTATNAGDMLSAVNAALQAVKTYASQIGASQDAMTAASNFNSALNTNVANGIGALVDADMNQASTRLQALQTQQQLGIQSLSIANQNSQLILKLFG